MSTNESPFSPPHGINTDLPHAWIDICVIGPYSMRALAALRLVRAIVMLLIPVGGGVKAQTLYATATEMKA